MRHHCRYCTQGQVRTSEKGRPSVISWKVSFRAIDAYSKRMVEPVALRLSKLGRIGSQENIYMRSTRE